MLAADYITTSLHWLFVALQLYAATGAPRASASPASGVA
jgi:hypothetical protein